jgi:hypothetical protein
MADLGGLAATETIRLPGMSPADALEFGLSALRANEGLIVALALSAGCLLALVLFTLIMTGAGASRRPVVFLAGLMAPIVLVFIVAQLVEARMPPAASAPSAGLAVEDGRLAARTQVFGADVPPEFIRDARGMLPGILDGAEIAEAAVTREGSTILVAQFNGEEAARQAAAAYHRAFGLTGTGGDEAGGWTARRSVGDYIEMLLTGRFLFVWSGLTPADASARRAASNLDAVLPAEALESADPLFPALQPLAALFATTWAKILGLLVLAGIYTAWFFKGASWAGSVAPEPQSSPVPPGELESRLLALNAEGLPFAVARGPAPGEFVADWCYADATYLDLARARAIRRTFRIRMVLDERTHTVRATDYTAEFDWSAGRSGADVRWRRTTGVSFFHREQETVAGVRIDRAGRRGDALMHSFTFDLAAMKGPLIRIVSTSGWGWRPALITLFPLAARD